MMLGKDRMAELRSIAKLHNLAAGSQTVPNSVAEIAAAQGQSPPRRSSPLGTFLLQTPQLLKLCLNNLPIRKPLLKPPKNFPPHHHASRLPLPSNLARVVVSTNPHLLL